METYITVLRGVNLGKHNQIKMDALKQLFVSLGFTEVSTYIQSGNVVFQALQKSTDYWSQHIHDAILNTFGLDIPTLTLTLDELQQVAAAQPWAADSEKDRAFFHVTFLEKMPQEALLAKIEKEKYLPDEWKCIGKAIYLYCPNGYGNTKLSNTFLENKLKVPATTRNWRTTLELIRIGEAII